MKMISLVSSLLTLGFTMSAFAMPGQLHCMAVDPSKISAALVKTSEANNIGQYAMKVSNDGAVGVESFSATLQYEYLPGMMIKTQTLTVNHSNEVFQHTRYAEYSTNSNGMTMFNNLPSRPGEVPREFITCFPYGPQNPN